MKCLAIVAHPDDETIWMGGTILRHPDWEWHILALSRASDPDRAPKFRRVGEAYGAHVAMSDLDDSPVLAPLPADLHEIKARVRSAECGVRNADVVFTHGIRGEYTRHERHEQVHRAVREMWEEGELSGDILFFAYMDDCRTHPPEPAPDAQIKIALTPEEYARKQEIIRGIYGFNEDSFEMASAGPIEAFTTPSDPETTVRLAGLLNADR